MDQVGRVLVRLLAVAGEGPLDVSLQGDVEALLFDRREDAVAQQLQGHIQRIHVVTPLRLEGLDGIHQLLDVIWILHWHSSFFDLREAKVRHSSTKHGCGLVQALLHFVPGDRLPAVTYGAHIGLFPSCDSHPTSLKSVAELPVLQFQFYTLEFQLVDQASLRSLGAAGNAITFFGPDICLRCHTLKCLKQFCV